MKIIFYLLRKSIGMIFSNLFVILTNLILMTYLNNFFILHPSLIVETLGFFAMFIGILSFISHKQNQTRFILGISSFFWTFHYYLLNAYTTAGIQLVLVFRNFISIFIKNTKIKHIVFWILISTIFILCIITWQGWKSLIPLAAAFNSTYALCYLDNKKMRQFMVLTSILWMVNGIIWNSWPQVFAEIIKIGINLFVSHRLTGDINAEDSPEEEEILEKENTICHIKTHSSV